MKEKESVQDYSSKLSEIVNQMKLYGDETKDQRVVQKFWSVFQINLIQL